MNEYKTKKQLTKQVQRLFYRESIREARAGISALKSYIERLEKERDRVLEGDVKSK